jgi:SAM-dependent methyltransferase
MPKTGATDPSNGWEAVAPTSLRHSTVGLEIIQAWANQFPRGASILDIGCGPGGPRSEVLINSGFAVYAVDAAPTMASNYQRYFPTAHVTCEPAEASSLFGRIFDGVLAWGLIFLLPADTQRDVIHRIGRALQTGGRFLFTAPTQECTWLDNSTGRTSWSLGIGEYVSILAAADFELVAESTDEGENHYYDAIKL